MKLDANEQENIRRYLLGRVPPQDLPALEERLFLDSELYEELSIIEDELIDEYLRGELAPSDRERFEAHFMSAPERYEKMRFARALKKCVSAEADLTHLEPTVEDSSEETDNRAESRPSWRVPWFPPVRNPIVAYSVAASLILILVAGAWLAITLQRQGNASEKLFAIQLAPGLTRDGDIKNFSIPAGFNGVQLQLVLSDQYPSYVAVLQDAEGRTLLEKDLKGQSLVGQPAVSVDVPLSLLPPGDYRVKLNGLKEDGNAESVGTYSFRILKQ